MKSLKQLFPGHDGLTGRRAVEQRIYLTAPEFGSPVTLHTGRFASLDREIKLSSYTVAAALLRTLRTLAEQRPELLPALDGDDPGANTRPSHVRRRGPGRGAASISRVRA
jgi:hypothetical protein